MTESVRHHDDGFQAQTDPVQAMVRAHARGTDRLVAGGLGSGGDFSDFSHEWRRLFSRLLGTFLLVLVAAGASVIQDRSTGQIGRIAKVAAPALTVLTVNLFMSAVSGAHLNPIVSVTFALGHDFRWRRVPGYILAQLLGALLAALLLRATFGDVAHLGATLPGSGFSTTEAFIIEVVLTGSAHRLHRPSTGRCPTIHQLTKGLSCQRKTNTCRAPRTGSTCRPPISPPPRSSTHLCWGGVTTTTRCPAAAACIPWRR